MDWHVHEAWQLPQSLLFQIIAFERVIICYESCNMLWLIHIILRQHYTAENPVQRSSFNFRMEFKLCLDSKICVFYISVAEGLSLPGCMLYSWVSNFWWYDPDPDPEDEDIMTCRKLGTTRQKNHNTWIFWWKSVLVCMWFAFESHCYWYENSGPCKLVLP